MSDTEDEVRAARFRRKGMIEVNLPFDPKDPNSPHRGDCLCDRCLPLKLEAAGNGNLNESQRFTLYQKAAARIKALEARVIALQTSA